MLLPSFKDIPYKSKLKFPIRPEMDIKTVKLYLHVQEQSMKLIDSAEASPFRNLNYQLDNI